MLNSKRTYSYFRDRYPLKKSTNSWFSFDCPICGKKDKGAVHFDYEQVKCWVGCYKEGIVSWVASMEGQTWINAYKLLMSYEEANIDVAIFESVTSTIQVSDVHLPSGFRTITNQDGILGKRAREYMVDSRGIDLDLLDYLGVGYVTEQSNDMRTNYFGYIITPFKKAGKLYYYAGRDFIGNPLKHKNPPVTDFGIGKSELFFNEDSLNRKTALVMESAFCAMTMGRSGSATLGKSLSNRQRAKILRSHCINTVIIYDKGAYRDAIKAGMDLLGHKKVFVVDLDRWKGEGKDPNEIGKKNILDLIADTKELTFDEGISILM